MQHSTSVRLPAVLILVCALAACGRETSGGPDSASIVIPPPPPTAPAAPELPASTGAITDMTGPQWKLESFDVNDPVPPGVDITLAVNDDRLSGQGGCNRYTGPVANGDGPGKLLIGPLVSTEMACTQAADAAELRYMEALQRANAFSVHGRRLLLTYADGETIRTLVYSR